jgi:protein-tyrosine phosphatase
MFTLIAIPFAIATACTLGYMGSKILLFGLVKPEDVESDLETLSQSGNDKVLPERKPVARSLPSHFQRVVSKPASVQSRVSSHPPTTQTIGALARQSFMAVLPALDCGRVTCNLFVGSYPRDSKEVEDLRSVGITAILSLQTDEDLEKRAIEWEEKAALAADLTFQSVPVRDFDTGDLQQKLPDCVLVLDRMLKTGHTVYLHCTAGVNRSATVAAAYLHWCLAWPLERALAHVRSARDCSPNAEAIRCAQWPSEPRASGSE